MHSPRRRLRSRDTIPQVSPAFEARLRRRRGIAYTNFSRFFSNLEITDASGEGVQNLDELRYANISMLTWTTDLEFLGMRYGALAGVPFSTGNLRPSGDDVDSGFGLGDVLITPLALYGESTRFDYQVQLTVWTASGRFSPGADDNRGAGFWALVYSLGGVFYPGGDRERWSLSAVARIEQNFEQADSGITPGDDIVVDWGVGRIVHAGGHPIDIGVSGFAAWQMTTPDRRVRRDRHESLSAISASGRRPACPLPSGCRFASARTGSLARTTSLRETTFGSFSTTAGE